MKPNPERKLVLLFCAGILGTIATASLLAPPNDDSDKSPTTYNSGSAGIKAAYLLLDQLGYTTSRWEQPPSALANVDASNAIVIFAEPDVPPEQVAAIHANIAAFLNRGGRILITGPDAALLLPDVATSQPTQPFGKLCVTESEGRSAIARAGHVSIPDQARWTAMTPATHVEQWCGGDAVVVSYHVGAGTVVWWSSAQPLTNLGLKSDASLKLLLASIDKTGIDAPAPHTSSQPRPTVYFDEYFHGIKSSLSDYTHGLPLPQIAWQLAAVALLLVLSFGRRNGPIRPPLRLPRTSPIEFAESMGDLYRKAGATQAATDGARRRLLRFLVDRCGLPRAQSNVQSNADTIAEDLTLRFAGDWTSLAQHLNQAAEAHHTPLTPRSALALVKALDADLKTLAERIAQPNHP